MYAIAGKRLLLSCADVPQLTGQGIEPRTCTPHHIPQDLRWNRTNSRMCLSYIASAHSATCHNDRYSNLSYFYIHSGFSRSVCNGVIRKIRNSIADVS